MKKIFVLILFISQLAFSQEEIEITKLLKEWKLETCERNGIVKTAEELERENEFIVFYKNNKFKMKDEETTLNGIWKYNTKTRSLELNLIELGHKINFKIVKLNDNELSYIHEELDNNMIFNLKPNIKK
ncbi:hypothetical protein [Flavobacterium sp.]|uniref:hypothetical protein n=1 Tax=Flavobacterium sp. TaxID=239 RepID=UPI0035B25148